MTKKSKKNNNKLTITPFRELFQGYGESENGTEVNR